MASIKVYCVELRVSIGTNSVHKSKHVLKEANCLRILGLQLWVFDMTETPVEGSVEVCNSSRYRRPDEIQRGGGMVIRPMLPKLELECSICGSRKLGSLLDKSLGIELPVLKMVTVENITSKGMYFLAVDNFGRA